MARRSTSRQTPYRNPFWPVLLSSLVWACATPPATGPPSQRLVDVFELGMIEGRVELPAAPTPTEWRFDGAAPARPPAVSPATRGFEALAGISGLRVEAGKLTGTVVGDFPVLGIRRTAGLDNGDLLHEVRIRMKASGGHRVAVHFVGAEVQDFDRAAIAGKAPFGLVGAPLKPSGELETYVIKAPFSVSSSAIHHLLIQPTDSVGASFEIESVRLVFRNEMIFETPTGISWEGFSDVYRETVLAHAPEAVLWRLTLPERPRLEVALGTVEEQPVIFRITAVAEGEEPRPLIERSLTTPSRWDVVAVDLDELAGRRVTLRLELEADEEGIPGLWGSPVVRNRIAPGARWGAAASGTPSGPPQGVVFVLTDTLRSDRLGLYGHQRPTSPVIDRMAQDGAVFQDTIAQGTWTKVSAASMFTSLYPTTVGVLDVPHRVPSSATTLAEVFREAGFATLGLSSVSFTGRFSNLHQGYEVMLETTLGKSKTARDFVDRLLPWLESHRDERFFVMLHVMDPHSPFEPRPPYDSLWIDPIAHRHLRDELRPAIADPVRRYADMPTREEVASALGDPAPWVEGEMAWYDGSIRAMDRELGRVFERLRELGLDERTLVVLTSDHGEEFLEHGRMFHGQSVYGELANVPLVFRFPGVVPAGLRIEETVQLIDVMPTVLELAGLPVPKDLQGASLVPLLAEATGSMPLRDDGRRWRTRPAISQRPASDLFTDLQRSIDSTAIVFEGWKLIHHREPIDGQPEYELFDHRSDPHDFDDVAVKHPEIVARLATALDAWRAAAQAAKLPDDAEGAESLSSEELRRLRALGYVE